MELSLSTDITKMVTEKTDAILKISPGKDENTYIEKFKKDFHNAKIHYVNCRFSGKFITSYHEAISNHIKEADIEKNKVALLDFCVPFNENNLVGIKEIINIAKIKCLQVLVVLQTSDNLRNFSISTISYYTKIDDLLVELEKVFAEHMKIDTKVNNEL